MIEIGKAVVIRCYRVRGPVGGLGCYRAEANAIAAASALGPGHSVVDAVVACYAAAGWAEQLGRVVLDLVVTSDAGGPPGSPRPAGAG
jgi:hypothetical protein